MSLWANYPAMPNMDKDIELTESDIQFECPHCANILIVDRAGIGLEVACAHCQGMVIVPEESRVFEEVADETLVQPEFDFSDLSAAECEQRRVQVAGRLKENESQRTEIQSYINKATIELHRWQLQIRKLDTKNRELKAELEALDRAAN